MRKTEIAVLLFATCMGGFLIFYHNRPAEQNTTTTSQTKQQTNTTQQWESKTDQSTITVTVTPTDLSPSSKEWKFNISMDTHSVELDQDLVETTVLVDDQNKEYKALRWEGPVGGHHREGVLVFNALQPSPKSVGIKIKDLDGVTRSFFWKLQ